MPIFIPDRLKTPGEFPSIDANDNQIRGFGFFADNDARTALAEDFRCQGYLAFMKDTLQFKQYESRFNTDEDWGDDANWDLLEGTTTDTYWAVDSDGTGIYYSNQVIVGGSTYGGDEKLYVNGDAKISGHLVASEIQSASGIDFKIDTDASGGASEDFAVKYNNGSDTYRDAFVAKPFASTPSVAFGNTFDDFKLDHYSSSFSEFRTLSASVNETGFKFTDFAEGDGVMLFRMKDNESYLELSDGGRKVTVVPQEYKIFSDVEADVTVTHGAEILLPDTATGDTHFKNIGNKNFLFSTNTGSGSPTEILEMKPDLVVSNVNLEVNGSGNFLGDINVGVADSDLTGLYLRRTDNALMGGIRTNDNNTVIIGGFNNDKVQIARHTSDGVLDDEVMGHFNTTGLGLGTTSPSQKLHVVGSMYLADSAADGNTLIGSGWSSLTGKNNTAVGYQALENLTTSSYNTAVGYQAQKSFTGQQSVAVGFRAGQNATGSHTCVGYAAGQSISGGTYVGHTAGSGSAVDSTVVGKESYRNVSSGGLDVIVGHQVMWSDKTSKNTASNISIGNAAQYFAGNDSYNVAIGGSALRGNEQGADAGYLNRTKNIALGHGSMYRAYSGANNNIVLGYQAAYSQQIATDEGDLSTVTFANNVFIGHQSAYDITSGSQNVAIGEQSAYNLTEGSGNVLIGYMAGYNLTTESNRLYIANSNADTPLIYGDFSTGDVGIGTTNPLAKLHVFDSSVAIGNVGSYDGGLSSSHSPGTAAPGSLHLHGTGLVMSGGRFIISTPNENIFANSSSISFKGGGAESSRQATLGIGSSNGGLRIGTNNNSFHYVFGRYGMSITDNTDTVGTTVDKPLYIKPRFPNANNDGGYTGGGNDGSSVNQSLVYPLYFHYADAPSTLENLRIRTQINDAYGASYNYGLDYDVVNDETVTQGDTGNPFTANKNTLKISATFPFAQSQTDADGLHTSLSGVVVGSEASLEIRNAYETDVSGGTNANTAGTINTALYVGGQRFFEPRSRNSTILYGFGGVNFTRASNYGTTGDLSPEDNDLVNAVTTDVTGGTVGSYVLSTSNSGEITLGSSTYDTAVDGHLSLKVTLSASDNVSAVEIISGGQKITSLTGFRSGDTITIPATKLGSSSTATVITLSNDSFVTDGATVSMSFSNRSSVGINMGSTNIRSNDTSTGSVNLGAGGSFHLARTANYTSYRDHWFKYIEGTEVAHWTAIQGGFLKQAKLMVGYSNDNQVAYDGTAINTANYGAAALRVVASTSGMRVGSRAVASNSSSVLKFAEADLDAAGFTDESSTWGADYDTDGGWYVGMPIYVSEAGTNHIITKVRPDGAFQYNSGSDTSTFQRKIVVDINNTNREMTLDSAITTSSGDVLVYPATESDLIRCRNLMGRDMFVVKSSGRLDLENGVMKLRAADHDPGVIRNNGLLGVDECLIWYDGTNLKIVKGSGSTIPITIG